MSLTATPTTLAPGDALAILDERLDLKMVRLKLADPEEGTGATEAALNEMERDYRRFLALHLAYPDTTIVPTKAIDAMWHQHILDTSAYRDDCDAIFGRFLDHFPYFGMRDDQDARDLEDAFDATLVLWRNAFGEPLVAASGSGRCRRQCAPMKCK